MEQTPQEAPALQHCDTISFGSDDLWRFIPLRCALDAAAIGPSDMQLVRSALDEMRSPIDSIWVWLPGHYAHVRPVRVDSIAIQIDLQYHSGIMEEKELERTGMMREGNWSGLDGTLVIDKRTEAHHVELWQ